MPRVFHKLRPRVFLRLRPGVFFKLRPRVCLRLRPRVIFSSREQTRNEPLKAFTAVLMKLQVKYPPEPDAFVMNIHAGSSETSELAS